MNLLGGCRPERERLSMQYLLTEDERKALVHKDEVTLRDQALAAARESLLKLAGFTCIHDPSGANRRGYCSGCPCSPLGRDDPSGYAVWSRVCWLDKNFSQ